MPTVANQPPPRHFPVTAVQGMPIEVNGIASSIAVEACCCMVASTCVGVAVPALWGSWACVPTICTMTPDINRPALRTGTTLLGAGTPSRPSPIAIYWASMCVACLRASCNRTSFASCFCWCFYVEHLRLGATSTSLGTRAPASHSACAVYRALMGVTSLTDRRSRACFASICSLQGYSYRPCLCATTTFFGTSAPTTPGANTVNWASLCVAWARCRRHRALLATVC